MNSTVLDVARNAGHAVSDFAGQAQKLTRLIDDMKRG